MTDDIFNDGPEPPKVKAVDDLAVWGLAPDSAPTWIEGLMNVTPLVGLNEEITNFALLGERIAEAEAEAEKLEGQFIQWRSTMMETAAARSIKLPEWRAREMMQASPRYVDWKVRIGQSKAAITALRSRQEAIRFKIEVLKSVISVSNKPS